MPSHSPQLPQWSGHLKQRKKQRRKNMPRIFIFPPIFLPYLRPCPNSGFRSGRTRQRSRRRPRKCPRQRGLFREKKKLRTKKSRQPTNLTERSLDTIDTSRCGRVKLVISTDSGWATVILAHWFRRLRNKKDVRTAGAKMTCLTWTVFF